jgi:CTP:molybdopterin cytidylyltransferase MocA
MAGPLTEQLEQPAGPVDCIVLAGDRRRDDPLAVSAGVPGKALVPVGGLAMLGRVLQTLSQWGALGRLIVVAPGTDAYRSVIDASTSGIKISPVLLEPSATLGESILSAIDCCQTSRCLLLTADHVLLDRDWLETLLEAGGQDNANLYLGLADWHQVTERFPGNRRTRYRFSDFSACGTNLFLLKDLEGVKRILAVWKRVEQERKKPWRIISLLGWKNLTRYLAGRLSVRAAFSSLSEQVGAKIQPVLIDDPLAAVDVDSEKDLVLVEQVLSERISTNAN